MARPFITDREKIAGFIEGLVPSLNNLVIRTGIKQFEDAAEAGYYARQLIRFSKGKAFQRNLSPTWSSNFFVLYEMKKSLSRRFF
jgi:hypothetical protein